MASVDYAAWVLPHVNSVPKNHLASFKIYCSPCVAILGLNTVLALVSSYGNQIYAEPVTYVLLLEILGILIGVTFITARPLFKFLYPTLTFQLTLGKNGWRMVQVIR